MSSTQEKLDQVFFEQLRGKTVTKEQDHILEWASQRLKPALARLIDSAKREGAIEELRNLPSERHETSGWCDTGFFIDSEDRWKRIKELEQSEESI